MPFNLECAQSFSANDATEADINHAFDDDIARGEYTILIAPDGGLIQAAGEGEGPYVLEFHERETHFQAKRELTKSEVREAFLQYRRGDTTWRSSREWVVQKGGRLRPLVIALVFIAGLAAWWFLIT